MAKNYNDYGLPCAVELADDTVIIKVDGKVVTERHHAEAIAFDSLVEFCKAFVTP
ncbi:hypothetical protein GPK34_02425 [Secundilactobacillus kimchicus]|uniref:hypothetical protein n=1 Tax=Secundilactobacillus kimchicus TaxID=528209 RepID=UPI001C02BACF|nr:hypothetical protein [Secundilactobacillus kimchicus]MBT9670894.1 hypothetical protein [Secundilactobacillus kimchicus]